MAAGDLKVTVDITGVEPFTSLVANVCDLVNALTPDAAALDLLPPGALAPLANLQRALRDLARTTNPPVTYVPD